MLERVKAYHKGAPIFGFVSVAAVSALAFMSMEYWERLVENTFLKQLKKE